MTVCCKYCDLEQDGIVTDNGAISCSNCGEILVEDFLVEEPVFSKGPGGQSTLQGTLVRNYGSVSGSSITENKGADVIRMLAQSLNIDDLVENKANDFFKFAAKEKFTRRYKIDHVAAACLYVVCRKNGRPHLLIEFSAALSVIVYDIGAVYLQLYQLLRLQEHFEFIKPLDPSIFIKRFTFELVDKMDEESVKKHGKREAREIIEKTATLILTSMKRDWMQTGRKPSGLCSAAIYIAALANGIRFPKSDVMTVFHICEATLMKRLTEFENTESGGMTITEFEEREENFKSEWLDGGIIETHITEVLCEHKDEELHAHGLCKKCYDEFFEISGGLDGGSDPPCFRRPETEEAAEKIGDNPDDNPDNFNESENLADDDSECLSDIDDAEVDFYLNNSEEAELKGIIWSEINKEYLEEQALKDAMKAAEATDEIRAAQKKRKRQPKPSDPKNTSPARTATEATIRMLNKKGISNINPDALKSLFKEYDAGLNGVTVRVDCDAGQEEADNVNNFDDLNQDYEEHERCDPSIYYNDDQVDGSYYGGDENINYGDY